MTITPKIERAIRKAAVIHDGQRRRGGDNPPYVSHLFSVAAIVSAYSDDEDTIVSALLHDALEDTPYERGALASDFGESVARIVEGVSETKMRDGKEIPWLERKKAYIEALRAAPQESLYISAADKIHNLSSLAEEYRIVGDALWDIFKNPDDQLWFFREVLVVLTERLESEIVSEYASVYTEAARLFQKS